MAVSLPDGVLRRLLLVKQLLSDIPPLTPTTDALAVARGILTAHDAAELALATIADYKLPGHRKRPTYLMDYAGELHSHAQHGPLTGYDFVRSLNDQRVAFKHQGLLPNVPQWHTVGENVRRYVEQWCRDYLDTGLTDLTLDILIENQDARALYLEAKAKCDAGDYKGALERLGMALYSVLRRVTDRLLPVVGSEHVQDGLRLAAFGVNAGDFLTLQQLLPSVRFDSTGEGLEVSWERRKKGHPGNWTEPNVRFCLATFVDVAIKVQHAPWSPWPVDFYFIYRDTATAKRDGATVWREPTVAERLRGVERQPVQTLNRGDVLHGVVGPMNDPRAAPGTLAAIAPPSFENATAFSIFSDDIEGSAGVIFTDEFEIGMEPRDNEWVRGAFPHLFPPK